MCADEHTHRDRGSDSKVRKWEHADNNEHIEFGDEYNDELGGSDAMSDAVFSLPSLEDV
jgi:hypothetical protein